jgi:hydrogenase nickel incorporation protein HypA/HybF
MHEYPIVESLLRVALEHAEASDATRINTLNLVLSQMSSIEEESVRFYWEGLAKGTIAEGATLRFRRVPSAFRCFSCGADFTVDNTSERQCPQCGSAQVQVIAEEELRLESLDVD